MGTTAADILTLSYLDCGVIAEGETMTAALANQGLTRLNHMLAGWRTQYGTVLSVDRTIFPLVTNKQTYTIGLGGDFNVPRPLTIPGAGLLLQGLASAQAVTSITRSGYTATVTQTAHGFAVGDEAFIDGCGEIDYNGLQTVQTVPTANTYTFTVDGLPTTPATGTITVAAIDGQPVEIPRAVITDSAYQGIQLKNMPNAQFTNVYYNSTSHPFGTISLWPRINTAVNQLVLYLQSAFGGFANLTRQYDWPDNPGYAEAIQYQLDLRLLIAFPTATPRADIHDMAATTFGLIKRANNKINDVNTDATLLTRQPRGWYNINTGTGG